LVEVVAKGGSLLLGVGPKPDGTLPDEVIQKLEAIGNWTSLNGKAIYNTRSTKNYNSGKTWFTQSKDGKTHFAIYCLSPDEKATEISWNGNVPKKGSPVKLLETGQKVSWKNVDGKIILKLPVQIKSQPALAFEFEAAD